MPSLELSTQILHIWIFENWLHRLKSNGGPVVVPYGRAVQQVDRLVVDNRVPGIFVDFVVNNHALGGKLRLKSMP